MYRPGAKVGDGGTANALKKEFVNGSTPYHLQKSRDRLSELKKLIKNEKLNLTECDIAEALITDLEYAINYEVEERLKYNYK